MKIEPNKIYTMPLIMGPRFDQQALPAIDYTEVHVVALQYQTDPDAIPALLPDHYRPADEPIVTIFFGYYDGIDFMAGAGYWTATVQVAARFDGEEDHVEGDYILVMFENKTYPILCGREDLGIPKLYADISPPKITPDGHRRCEASLWGHLLFGMDLMPMKRQNPLVRMVANRRINARPWLGHKYIPSLDGPPDADYPTLSWNVTRIDQLWLGNSGEIYFGAAGQGDIGSIQQLVDALKTLPVRQVVQALRFRGSSTLRLDLSRRLR